MLKENKIIGDTNKILFNSVFVFNTMLKIINMKDPMNIDNNNTP
jgi:hypothetical protein